MWSLSNALRASSSMIAKQAIRPSFPSIVLQLQQQQVRHKGHSKWQNIKHIKQANDLRMSKVTAKHVQKIQVAIRENGNQGDPRMNRQLERKIEEALADNVRKASIDNAIKRATSKDFVDQKEFLYELRGPGHCSILVEALAAKKPHIDSVLNPVRMT